MGIIKLKLWSDDDSGWKLTKVSECQIHSNPSNRIWHISLEPTNVHECVALEKCHTLNDPNQLHPHWLFFLLCVIHCNQNCSQNQPPTAHPRLQQSGRKSIKVTHSHTHTHAYTHTQPGWLPQYLSEHLSNSCSISHHETIAHRHTKWFQWFMEQCCVNADLQLPTKQRGWEGGRGGELHRNVLT